MAKAPDGRYQTAAEMQRDLQAVVAALSVQMRVDLPSESGNVAARMPAHSAEPTSTRAAYKPRRPFLVAAALIIVGGGAVVGWLAWDRKPSPGNGAADSSQLAAPIVAQALTATAPGVTPTDITLGMSGPFSGPAKELGRAMQIGIETYFKHVNEYAGGIHGRKLKLLALDDGYEPARCLATMKEMINQRPVFAFVGNVGTPTAEAALPLSIERKRVFFGAFTGADVVRHDPPDRYVFNYRASYAEETASIVQHLLTVRGVKPGEIAVFAQQDGYGDAGFGGVAKRALEKAGFDTRRDCRASAMRATR